ncbi:MAG: cytochrome-c peroxidase, partial [Fimbriimonadaceae bacterium]|nr:cytochrome-c peroxidase [Chitinophagales bacterium]
ITKALAAFERTLISGNSKYDKAMNAVAGVFLTESEVEGYNLFFGDKLQCKNCHSGFNFTDQDFQNNGLLENYDTDEGRARITGLSEDIGKFKIPTLRNVELTAPYMHDGSIGTLNEVIDFYMSGGSNHPNKNNLIQAFTLTETEKQSLIDFLKTLTDETFINNPEWRNN